MPRTMLGPLVLNTLALARWVGQSAGSPQYYPRYNSTVDIFNWKSSLYEVYFIHLPQRRPSQLP